TPRYLRHSRSSCPASATSHTPHALWQRSRASSLLLYRRMRLLAYSASASASAFVVKGACSPNHRLRWLRYGAACGASGLCSFSRASPVLASRSSLPNKRLKLTGGDRFKGSGVLCPWRGTDFVPHLAPASESPAA